MVVHGSVHVGVQGYSHCLIKLGLAFNNNHPLCMPLPFVVNCKSWLVKISRSHCICAVKIHVSLIVPGLARGLMTSFLRCGKI